ncbi:peroxiredoxin [Candidatus Aquarickettsia rohweri]|uniref:Peroxiredoxin n=1 Tax=Candidatus Aquarickettsia rohweri TaxID=2602574 RepID=A0A3R9Z4Y7_9RICK|nr:peroxiredoxin [Candidatus Aquarickettsia rohweri]RST63832.1 peroxiredoxin [Candidatus Aquarickettsia rohweri]
MSFLIGKKAPDFKAVAIMGDSSVNENFVLSKFLSGKKGIIFFYPLDFTFVCPSEIIAFDKKLEEFKKKNTEVIGISIDSHFSHLAYKNTTINNGGIGNIKYPLVSDITKDISLSYDVLINQSIALRGTFLIDENFVIRHQVVNDLPLGRSVDEALRMVDALYFHQKHGEVCPANWKPGKATIKPDTEGIKNYLSENSDEI